MRKISTTFLRTCAFSLPGTFSAEVLRARIQDMVFMRERYSHRRTARSNPKRLIHERGALITALPERRVTALLMQVHVIN